MPFTDALNILDEEENTIRTEAARLEKLGVRALTEDFTPCDLAGVFLEIYEADYVYVPTDELGKEMAKVASNHNILECPNCKGLWIYNEQSFIFDNAVDIIENNRKKNMQLQMLIEKAEKEYGA